MEKNTSPESYLYFISSHLIQKLFLVGLSEGRVILHVDIHRCWPFSRREESWGSKLKQQCLALSAQLQPSHRVKEDK